MNSALTSHIYWLLIDEHGYTNGEAAIASEVIAGKLPEGLDIDYDAPRIEDAVEAYVINN